MGNLFGTPEWATFCNILHASKHSKHTRPHSLNDMLQKVIIPAGSADNFAVSCKSPFLLKIDIFMCFQRKSVSHGKGYHVPHVSGLMMPSLYAATVISYSTEFKLKPITNMVCTFTFLFQHILTEIFRFSQGYKLMCCITVETILVSGVRN